METIRKYEYFATGSDCTEVRESLKKVEDFQQFYKEVDEIEKITDYLKAQGVSSFTLDFGELEELTDELSFITKRLFTAN